MARVLRMMLLETPQGAAANKIALRLFGLEADVLPLPWMMKVRQYFGELIQQKKVRQQMQLMLVLKLVLVLMLKNVSRSHGSVRNSLRDVGFAS